MSVFQGDFLGFSLGENHSYNLNITRISTNDRYQDTLIPNFTDVTMQVPGGDGTYYWDSYYTQRTFTIDFAFDDLRDEDLRILQQMFSKKTVQPLVFDEFPYKKYMVKCQAPPQLRYICFDQYEMRVYKGEGTVTLIAYYPFGIATVPIVISGQDRELNNVGDLEANLKLWITETGAKQVKKISLTDINGIEVNSLNFNTITMQAGDKYLLIDMHTHLIEGLNSKKEKTGNLYNKFIASGDFFNVPVGRYIIHGEQRNGTILTFLQIECTPLYY